MAAMMPTPVAATAVTIAAFIVVSPIRSGRGITILGIGTTRPWRSLTVGKVALDDLVEFSAVEPHPPALGTVVDLDALPV